MQKKLYCFLLLPNLLWAQDIPLQRFTELHLHQGFLYRVEAADKNAIRLDTLPLLILNTRKQGIKSRLASIVLMARVIIGHHPI